MANGLVDDWLAAAEENGAQIRDWLEEAKARGATHMLVVADKFSYENYPVSVMPGQNVFEVADQNRTQEAQMRELMEVYSLALPLEPQLAERRSFHYEVAEDLADEKLEPVLMEFQLQATHEESERLDRLLEEPYPNLLHWRQAVRASVHRLRKLLNTVTP